ncbi:MAG: hypothetical protein H8E17_11435 [Deltaproteobacteria bacterium]|nr:hypothetical protein [Deltaproteobacteria bacterium]
MGVAEEASNFLRALFLGLLVGVLMLEALMVLIKIRVIGEIGGFIYC